MSRTNQHDPSPSSASSSTHYSNGASSSSRRPPASIQELAQKAELNPPWDPAKDFKTWLKTAERLRHLGQRYDLAGDLEKAFVEYAKAATLILDKIPTHGDYHTRLDGTQRETLVIKGKGILDRMSDIKPILNDRYNTWLAQPRERPREVKRKQYSVDDSNIVYEKDRASPARQMSLHGYPQQQRPPRTSSLAQSRPNPHEIWYPDVNAVAEEIQDKDLSDDAAQALLEMSNHRSRTEQEGIAARIREAEDVARSARYESNSFVPSNLVSVRAHPAPSLSSEPSSTNSLVSIPSFSHSLDSGSLPEQPAFTDREYALSSGGDDDGLYRHIARLSLQQSRRLSPSPSSTPNLVAPEHFDQPSYPMLTTTFPPSPSALSTLKYPDLMSQHQRTQGYAPSPSTFNPPQGLPYEREQLRYGQMIQPPYEQASLYSNSPPQPPQASFEYPYASQNSVQAPSRLYGPREQTPRPSIPTRPPSLPVSYTPPPYPQIRQAAQSQPKLPAPVPVTAPLSFSSSPRNSTSSISEKKPETVRGRLKNIRVPRVVLTKFLDIASPNTAKNRETCGLLLGRARSKRSNAGYDGSNDDSDGDRGYVVTTLLIPRQHSTSDTCTMDEEELVLEFSMEKELITLGWIHTHPTQSCFMSSVDLHTHAGFQRMLPESFAIVCAPQHSPKFGIFRLTDPPGLQTVLTCEKKEAFHPHPDIPIYTDADRGHVQLSDLPLDIFDLRRR